MSSMELLVCGRLPSPDIRTVVSAFGGLTQVSSMALVKKSLERGLQRTPALTWVCSFVPLAATWSQQGGFLMAGFSWHLAFLEGGFFFGSN
jgi:hypothetical protein